MSPKGTPKSKLLHISKENIFRFVLKPQREGGGNNIYGADIRREMLKMKNSKERTAWILMELIKPPVTKNYMVRPGGPEVPSLVEVVSELGIYGALLG